MSPICSHTSAPFHVVAPSRLHFGLLSFGNPRVRTFGGAGVMIDQPGCELRISTDVGFRVTGPLSQRVEALAQHWAAIRHDGRLPECHVHVVRVAPQHVGLGTGTQLALSLAYALERLVGRTGIPVSMLATSVGRGLRSAVGTYGFERGGFVAESGKTSSETLAPFYFQLNLPSQWRFLLLRPEREVGLSGSAEQKAFSALPPVPGDVSRQLRAEIDERMRPALESENLEEFGESIYRYGRLAGNCFSVLQGGPYASPLLAKWVKCLREDGVRGVGQSSWGPTVFALAANEAEAQQIVIRFRERARTDPRSLATVVSAPNLGGVRCVVP